MPNELELCAVSAVIAALLGGALGYTVAHKIDGAHLAHIQAAYADDIARINATSAQQLANALAKQQAAEGHVVTIQQQFDNEVAQHAKDSLDYRARLAAGTASMRVRVSTCHPSAPASQSAPAAPGASNAPAYADIDPTVASGVVQVMSDDQNEIDKLRALQDYVKGLQDDGYIQQSR